MIVTLSIFLFKYHQVCVTSLSGGLQYVPLETAVNAPHATIDPALYIAPPLRYGSTGDTQPCSGMPSTKPHIACGCGSDILYGLHYSLYFKCTEIVDLFLQLRIYPFYVQGGTLSAVSGGKAGAQRCTPYDRKGFPKFPLILELRTNQVVYAL